VRFLVSRFSEPNFWPHNPEENAPPYPLVRRVVKPKDDKYAVDKGKILPLPGIEFLFLCP